MNTLYLIYLVTFLIYLNPLILLSHPTQKKNSQSIEMITYFDSEKDSQEKIYPYDLHTRHNLHVIRHLIDDAVHNSISVNETSELFKQFLTFPTNYSIFLPFMREQIDYMLHDQPEKKELVDLKLSLIYHLAVLNKINNYNLEQAARTQARLARIQPLVEKLFPRHEG